MAFRLLTKDEDKEIWKGKKGNGEQQVQKRDELICELLFVLWVSEILCERFCQSQTAAANMSDGTAVLFLQYLSRSTNQNQTLSHTVSQVSLQNLCACMV